MISAKNMSWDFVKRPFLAPIALKIAPKRAIGKAG